MHILVLWLLRFLPPSTPVLDAPVAIRMLSTPPTALRSLPAAPQPPARKRQPPQKEPAKPTLKKGGILAELPKPVKIERPEDARLVAKYDSKAQDIWQGKPSAQRPSGHTPRLLPPELALPERYSQTRPQPPQQPAMTPPPPTPPPPTPVDQPVPQRQARRLPAPRASEKPQTTRQPDLSVPDGSLPSPKRQTQPHPLAPTPELRRFHITDQQELALVQRKQPDQQQEKTSAEQKDLSEHFARLEKRQPLPSPTFDAPGVYQRGPERRGEGRATEGGGKFRSIDAYGLKHFSYLVGVKRKIELLFSVPFFLPNQGTVGVPIVGFTIRRNGILSEAVLLRSSGYAALDKALLDAVRRAAPYGPFPNHLAEPEISIRVYATVS